MTSIPSSGFGGALDSRLLQGLNTGLDPATRSLYGLVARQLGFSQGALQADSADQVAGFIQGVGQRLGVPSAQVQKALLQASRANTLSTLLDALNRPQADASDPLLGLLNGSPSDPNADPLLSSLDPSPTASPLDPASGNSLNLLA